MTVTSKVGATEVPVAPSAGAETTGASGAVPCPANGAPGTHVGPPEVVPVTFCPAVSGTFVPALSFMPQRAQEAGRRHPDLGVHRRLDLRA